MKRKICVGLHRVSICIRKLVQTQDAFICLNLTIRHHKRTIHEMCSFQNGPYYRGERHPKAKIRSNAGNTITVFRTFSMARNPKNPLYTFTPAVLISGRGIQVFLEVTVLGAYST